MSPYANPDYQSLERTVLERPHDDLPRLVLADWLDEHAESSAEERCSCSMYGRDGWVFGAKAWEMCGRCQGTGRLRTGNDFAARAEFIRLQIELLRMPGSTELDDRREVVRLRLNNMIDSGLPAGWLSIGAADWTWSGDEIGPLIECRSRLIEDGGIMYGYRRGFIDEVWLPLAAFVVVAPRLAAEFPLTAVTLTDREPERPGTRDYWRWFTGDEDGDPAGLPDVLWKTFHDNPPLWISAIRRGEDWEFPTRDAAMQALSTACVAYCRRLAFPELPR